MVLPWKYNLEDLKSTKNYLSSLPLKKCEIKLWQIWSIANKSLQNIFIIDDYSVFDKRWKRIEFLEYNSLLSILEQNHRFIQISKNTKLYNLLVEIKTLLENWFKKITLAQIDWLKEELEWFGSWTMFVNLDYINFSNIEDEVLFNQIFDYQVKKKNWKQKNKKERKRTFDNYQVLEIDGTILWWYYLAPYQDGYKLENFFSFRNGGWIGKYLIDEIKSKWKIYAFSKQDSFFTKNWFQKIAWETSITWASLYVFNKSL